MKRIDGCVHQDCQKKKEKQGYGQREGHETSNLLFHMIVSVEVVSAIILITARVDKPRSLQLVLFIYN